MRPVFVGAIMAMVMLFMLHEPLMSGSLGGLSATIAFVAAHLAILMAVIGAVLLFPRLRGRILAHRPDGRHVALMLAGLVATGSMIHLIMHGGIV